MENGHIHHRPVGRADTNVLDDLTARDAFGTWPVQEIRQRPGGEDVEYIAPRPDPRVTQMRTLSSWDVAALIVNKMIGTGIFTGPSMVLQLTLNKNVAIGLWILGLLYTILSMLLYIEYARKLPFTGGELVYLDDALPKPRLLAYTLYSFYFVFLYTSTANCISFARFVLAASNTSNFDWKTLDDKQPLVRFMAVVAITAVCLLLYVSNTKSKFVNLATASAKVLLLLGAIFAGAAYVAREHDAQRLSIADVQWDKTASGVIKWPLALVTVLFSFHGWENATLVAGEVDSFKVLRRGFLLAVSGVGALYISMAILLCAAFKWEGDGSKADVPLVPLSLYLGGTFENTGSGAVAAAILISLSAFGSILSVSYTCVRVKQSIGWANILPWSSTWRRQGPIRPEYRIEEARPGRRELVCAYPGRAFNRPGTPEGGIILHWCMTIIYICATAGYRNLSDAAIFANQILVYGHFFSEAAVGLLFVRIGAFGFRTGPVVYFPALDWHQTPRIDEQAGNPPKWLRPSFAPWLGPAILGLGVFSSSFVAIAAACVEPSGRILLYVVIGVLSTGVLYWCLFVRFESGQAVYRSLGFEMSTRIHGVDDTDDPLRVCDWCATLNCEHRHPNESYYSYNVIRPGSKSKSSGARILNWVFSGSSRND